MVQVNQPTSLVTRTKIKAEENIGPREKATTKAQLQTMLISFLCFIYIL